jgi:hypothetical protein
MKSVWQFIEKVCVVETVFVGGSDSEGSEQDEENIERFLVGGGGKSFLSFPFSLKSSIL